MNGYTVFADLMASVTPAILSGAQRALNAATENNTYELTSRMLKGRDMSQTVKGGGKIQDYIFLKQPQTASFIDPWEEIDYASPQTMVVWEGGWRFLHDYTTWSEPDVDLVSGSLTGEAKFWKMKDHIEQKHMAMWTSTVDKIENGHIAVPDVNKMEDTGGKQPYSINAGINEWPVFGPSTTQKPIRGLRPALYDSVQSGTWTTFMGINPTTPGNENWGCYQDYYEDLPSTAGGVNPTWTLFRAFSRTLKKTKFQRLPGHAKFSDPNDRPKFIAASIMGCTMYEEGVRGGQNFFTDAKSDPAYPNGHFAGIPLVYVSSKDEAPIYPTGGGSVGSTTILGTEEDTDGPGWGGARFEWISEFVNFAVHDRNYFRKDPPQKPGKQPLMWKMDTHTWYNLLNRNRRTCAVVYPWKSGATPNADLVFGA
ncbi:MAG: hypothetical protein B7733_06390 [Myxococcales bacterium FL481]|nr:MAG: hypothetical protein B7733_06390 [Myxococcales bacterium FL481]